MSVDWRTIVDVARGLGTEADRRAVETDPEARRRWEILRRVVEVAAADAADPVPELWRDRAKALLPGAGAAPDGRRWFGERVFAGSPALGYRSASASTTGELAEPRDLRYEFPSAAVDLRLEPLALGGGWSFVGQYEGPNAPAVAVIADGRHVVWCEDDGRFAFEVPSALAHLAFVDAVTLDRYEIDLS